VTPRFKVKFTTAICGLLVLALLTGRASPGFPLLKVSTAIGRAIHQTFSPQPSKPAAPVVATVARASGFALSDIPPDYLGLYITAAKRCPALTWQVLAGIGKVETDHGRTPAPGVHSGVNSYGCCSGPMQFNIRNGPPSTWDTYGDGNPTHVYQPQYAIPAAANKLCTDALNHPTSIRRDPCPTVTGTPAQHAALLAYNHACWYVHQVLTLATRYTTTPTAATTPGNTGNTGNTPSPPVDAFTRALAANPRLQTTSSHGCNPKADLANPQLDLRIQSLLVILSQRWTVRISCIHTGHTKHVEATTRISNHYVWRAIDIDQVNHQPVGPGASQTKALLDFLDTLQGPLRPVEVGSPFQIGHRPFFTNQAHQEHIHIGYGPL
jgi:hypothetical protein